MPELLERQTMIWDTIIVGAGPAGATAAVHLASLGQKILLLDKENFPRHKICGYGLIADSLRCLDRMDLTKKAEKQGKIVNCLSYYSPSQIRVDTIFIKNILDPKFNTYRKAEKWLTKIWLNDFLARRAQKSKYIQKCLVDLLEEKASPEDFLSLKRLFNFLTS